jgi:hypothetical protein
MRRFLWVLLPFLFPWLAASQTQLEPADEKALRDLEQQVTDLKQEVHRSKAQTHELEEAVLRGKITGSKAYIVFDNQAEGFFAFSSAEFYVDGNLVKKIEGEKRSKPLEKLEVFDSNLPPGDHTLAAKIRYHGSDKAVHTMFSYFKDHKFIVETTEKFPVEYGKTTQIQLVALDRGYFKSDLNERLYMEIKVLKDWGTGSPE